MKEAPHHYLLKEKKLSFANNMISFCTSRTQKNTTKQNCMITDSPILFWTHLNVRHRVWMYQPSGFCSCKVKPVLVFVWFIWLRCPGFNSTVPALSHYHTEQTECVCRVVKLSSAFWQHPPPTPTSRLLPSHLLLVSIRVICRLHTYTAYLSGDLSVGLWASVYVCVHLW